MYSLAFEFLEIILSLEPSFNENIYEISEIFQ
jgi:hypothetical protein